MPNLESTEQDFSLIAALFDAIQYWHERGREFPALSLRMTIQTKQEYNNKVREYYDLFNSETNSSNARSISQLLAEAAGNSIGPTSISSFDSRETSSNRPDSSGTRTISNDEFMNWLLAN